MSKKNKFFIELKKSNNRLRSLYITFNRAFSSDKLLITLSRYVNVYNIANQTGVPLFFYPNDTINNEVFSSTLIGGASNLTINSQPAKIIIPNLNTTVLNEPIYVSEFILEANTGTNTIQCSIFYR